MPRLPFLWLSATLLFAPPAAHADDVKDAINTAIRAIRATQNEDGTYGPADRQPMETIAALYAFGRSPEGYTTQDGPFVRDAVEAVLLHQEEDGGFGHASSVSRQRAIATGFALTALEVTATGDRYQDALERARSFITSVGEQRHSLPPPQTESIEDLVKSVNELSADLSVERLPELLDLMPTLIGAYADAQATASASDDVEPAPAPRPLPTNDAEALGRMQEGLAFLERQQQDGRFGFGEVVDPGITAIALAAVIKTCDAHDLDRPDYVAGGLDYLASLQKDDGGIYDQGLKNYVTSVAIEALVASGDPKYRPVIDSCSTFLIDTQLDEGEGYSAEEDPYYGGFGYGSSEKPDLSNTQMALQALHEAGVPEDHEAYAKAVDFLQRCQNRAETGAPPIAKADGTVVVPGTDGGARYRPGDSKAGTVDVGEGTVIARSYGSMTYALLKSYLFAGLDPDDPRVSAAIGWICEHYTLEENPGFETARNPNARYQGLYYYYLTLARALEALGQDQVTDADGVEHDWRNDLRNTLFALQATDGHWVNRRSSRWMEGNPVLTTSYALLGLAETAHD